MASSTLLAVLLLIVIATAQAAEEERKKNDEENQRKGRPSLFTNIKDYPYQASLGRGFSHVCAGVIVSDRHILTSASCAELSIDWVRVGLNRTNIKGKPTIKVESTKVHPKYSVRTGENDVAVLKLKTKLTFSEGVQKVKFPFTYSSSEKFVGNFTGYGLTEDSVVYYKVLQRLLVDAFGYKTCRERYNIPYLTKDKFCAKPVSVPRHCVGDFGDPFVFKGTVYGVLSWSRVCNSDRIPLVFSSVSYAMDFISTVRDLPV